MKKWCQAQVQRSWQPAEAASRDAAAHCDNPGPGDCLPGTRKRLSLLLLLIVMLCPVGCGGDSLDTVPVSGMVTIDGTPLENGIVRFVPVDTANGRMATGTIKAGGKFELSTAGSTGVLEGDYKVTVESMKITPDVPEKDRELGIGGKESAIPKKYNSADTSGLTETVDGSKTVTLDLKSK